MRVLGKERLRLGGTVYIWRAGHLQDAHGADVPLRAKSLKMFAALLENRGTVLSKDRLSDLVWPNTTATDESIARCIADIRKALRDDQHETVQTFPKEGYRLNVEAVSETRPNASALRPLGLLFGVAAAVAALIFSTFLLRTTTDPIDPASVAIAPASVLGKSVTILPFIAETEVGRFLAAGLTEDLEIHLAEISGLRVLSQAQSAVGRGTPSTPADLVRSLGTRYVIDGSLRQSEERMSLTLRLLDGADGATLWAERYEGPRTGIMEFRDRVTSALVEAMSIELSEQDRRRLALHDTDDPQAYEAVMRARQSLSIFTYEGSLAAEKYLRQAINLDPDYARAYAELASVFAIRMENNWIVLSAADPAKAFHFAEKALSIDPDLWFGHYVLGRLHSVAEGGDIGAALDHLETAMRLQPANDDARIYFAIVTMMSGDPDGSAPIFRSVMDTHPQPPFWYHLGWANALFHMQRYEEALEAVSQCLRQMSNSPYCLRSQIAILARLGRIEDAEWAIEEYAILGHDTSLDAMMKTAIERDAVMREHLREAYALAGLE